MFTKRYDNSGQGRCTVCLPVCFVCSHWYGYLVFFFSIPTACPLCSAHLGDSAVRFSDELPTLLDPSRSLHVVWHVALVSDATVRGRVFQKQNGISINRHTLVTRCFRWLVGSRWPKASFGRANSISMLGDRKQLLSDQYRVPQATPFRTLANGGV